MESQRLSSIAPFTVPHAALTDTKLQGYTIPKVHFPFSIILLWWIKMTTFIHIGRFSDGKLVFYPPWRNLLEGSRSVHTGAPPQWPRKSLQIGSFLAIWCRYETLLFFFDCCWLEEVALTIWCCSGKRNCLGESLAKNTYYLFATAVMKTFNIERIANEELPTLDPINGFTIGYKGFRAVLRERSPHWEQVQRLCRMMRRIAVLWWCRYVVKTIGIKYPSAVVGYHFFEFYLEYICWVFVCRFLGYLIIWKLKTN